MTYGNAYGDQGGPRRRGGFPMRFIIGGILALVAVVGYYSKTQTNEVTGEKQRVAWGPEQEMALGLEAAPKLAAQMGGFADPMRDPRAAKVDEIGKRLVYQTDAAKSAYAQKRTFRFHLLNDAQMVNAFALPGGQIFITRALYDRLENEAQLAGVLGHEIGHVIHKHGAEHAASGQFGTMLATAFGVAASDGSGGGNMAAMGAQMANQMVQLKYGRGDELESDAYGLRLMIDVGLDPAEMLGVMRVLAEAGKGNRQPEMLLTHPYPESRVEQIKQILTQYKDELADKRLSKGGALR